MGMTEYLAELAWEKYRLEQQGYTVKSSFGASGGPGSSGPSGTYGDWSLVVTGSPARAPVATQPAVPSVVTGIDPSEVANALYGKPIPLSALGLARIGTAGLIFGPYFSSGQASFAVSFGFPANPAGTRRIYEISLDSKVAWESSTGNPEGAIGAGFTGASFECRFYSGTMTQAADPLEVAMFGAESVAYRPQMTLWFTNLPVEQFDGKVPFVSAKIGDVTAGAVPGDGLNLGDALQRVAYSPWIEYDVSTFETSGVADIVQAMILTEDQTFLDLLRNIGRVYRTFDILQTDKLRINDRGAVVMPDVTLERDHISAESGVAYTRLEESSVPRELELIAVDPDADYVFMPSKASRPRTPVPVTSAVGKDSITLPVVIGATTRASLVTYAKYEEDNARKRISLQTMLYGYALEPGDLFRLSGVANGFDQTEVFKVISSSHGANYTNEISGEAILKCSLTFDDVDPYWADVILLLHANSAGPVIDSSIYNNSMNVHGGAYVDTTIKKYGAASFRLTTLGDIIWTQDHWESWDISPTNTSPYTIELWARFDAVGASRQTLICRSQAFVASNVFILFNAAGSDELTFTSYHLGPTATVVTAGANLVNGFWYHIAVDKDSTGKLRIYVNGAMKASGVPADSVMPFSDIPIAVGAIGPPDLLQHQFVGNIDDVRITKRSRYGNVYGDAGFLPSGIQFPHGS
jgi:Concanavalin A-like lectin/glucanases superfamily/Putative phage tail protein